MIDSRKEVEETWKPVLDLWSEKGIDKLQCIQFLLCFEPEFQDIAEQFLMDQVSAEAVLPILDRLYKKELLLPLAS